MKKFIVLIAFTALIAFIVFKNSVYNPYSGYYECKSNSNLVLKLNKDNSFLLSYSVGKASESVNGKYQVEDNNITLTTSKDNVDTLFTNTLHGKIDGSMIKVTELNDEFIKY
ncbi:hypothetical protein [Candidatus Clostridium radicumherbarum]|uniref:Uncharacterized protein n=1 Tax=Candidatus Clostridium radicumherbarum TaxID=3381662 RepID=A0ABW8TUR0_9CLOT